MIVALLYLLLVESAPAIRLTYSSPSSPVTDWTLEVGGEVWSAAVPVPNTRCGKSTAAINGNDTFGAFYKRISNCTITRTSSGNSVDVELAVRQYVGGDAVVFSTKILGAALHPTVSSASTGGWKSNNLAPIIGWPSFPIPKASKDQNISKLDAAQWMVWNRGQLGDTVGPSNISAAFEQLNHIASPLVLVDRSSSNTMPPPPPPMTLIISPLDHFYTSVCHHNSNTNGNTPAPTSSVGSPSSWGCGIANVVPYLPAGFESETILFAGGGGGGGGVTQTLFDWGKLMQKMSAAKRVYPDVATTALSIFTDNGAFYNLPINHEASTNILKSMVQRLSADGIKIGIIQLDDFWYNAEDAAHMRLDDPIGNATLFPNGGIANLASVLDGIPLDVYANYFSPTFPGIASAETVEMDLFGAPGRIPVGPSSLTFYRTLFKEWVTTAAMQSYEIDFMEWFVYNVTAFYATPAGATVWMDGLAQAAAELNVPIQICTATGFDVMQALHYPAVTNVRASPDYRDFPNHLVGPGFLFAWVLGLKPSKDVTWTTEYQPTKDFYPTCLKGGNHSNVELDLILAAFSTGPISIGDAVGYTNATRARAVAMADGTLLVPSKPWTPVDFTLWLEGKQAVEYSDCSGGSAHPQHVRNCTCIPQLLQSYASIPASSASSPPTARTPASAPASAHSNLAAAHRTGSHYHFVLAVAVADYRLQEGDIWPALSSTNAATKAVRKKANLVDSAGAESAAISKYSYVFLQRTGLDNRCLNGTSAISSGCIIKPQCDGGNAAAGVVGSAAACLPVVSSGRGFEDPATYQLAWQFTMMVPVAGNGWVVLGELDKYVPVSPTRFLSITSSSVAGSDLVVVVAGSHGEVVVVSMVTPGGIVVVKSVAVGADTRGVIKCSTSSSTCIDGCVGV